MSEYHPDVWVIVKISGAAVEEPYYRVFSGWYGGYTGSDSWKMNSGITKIVKDDNGYEIYGFSGSTYFCHKNTEKMSMYMSSVLSGMQKQADERGDMTLEVVGIDTILDKFTEATV
jgi:hypothetical protein